MDNTLQGLIPMEELIEVTSIRLEGTMNDGASATFTIPVEQLRAIYGDANLHSLINLGAYVDQKLTELRDTLI